MSRSALPATQSAYFALCGASFAISTPTLRLGMTRTSLVWANGSDPNVADGWNDQGQSVPHEKRSKVRVAGSMNTTISDLSKFAAALVSGDGLSPASRAEMTKPSLHITTAGLFPLFQPDLPPNKQRKDLASGLGVTVFDGPDGHGFLRVATMDKPSIL